MAEVTEKNRPALRRSPGSTSVSSWSLTTSNSSPSLVCAKTVSTASASSSSPPTLSCEPGQASAGRQTWGGLRPQSEERPDSGLRLLPPQPQGDYVAQPDLLPPIRPVSRVTSPSTSTRRHDHAPRRAQVRRGPPGARPAVVISLRPAAGHSRVRLHAPP